MIQSLHRPGVRQVPEGSGELGKMEKTGCKIICGAPVTLTIKGNDDDDDDDDDTTAWDGAEAGHAFCWSVISATLFLMTIRIRDCKTRRLSNFFF